MSLLNSWLDYFAFLLTQEGTALENVSGDSGGVTKFGIDAASHPGVNVPALTQSQADFLHYADYAKTLAGRLPQPLNWAYFDFAMNAGAGEATRALQASLGAVQDGSWGPLTDATLTRYLQQRSAADFLAAFSAAREQFYRRLVQQKPAKQKFLRGWLNRVNACQRWCVARLQKTEGAFA